MVPVLAQAAEAVQAAKGWGDQLPALGLGLAAVIVLVLVFLRFLKTLLADFRADAKERHDATLKIAAQANDTQRETNQLLGQVNQSLVVVAESDKSTRQVLHKTRETLDETTRTLALNTAALQAAHNRG
jgi:uncharacterized protein YoxC